MSAGDNRLDFTGGLFCCITCNVLLQNCCILSYFVIDRINLIINLTLQTMKKFLSYSMAFAITMTFATSCNNEAPDVFSEIQVVKKNIIVLYSQIVRPLRSRAPSREPTPHLRWISCLIHLDVGYNWSIPSGFRRANRVVSAQRLCRNRVAIPASQWHQRKSQFL